MSNKTKITKTSAEKIGEVAQQAGIVLMAAAATLGMLELPDHPNSRIVLASQPTFAFAKDSYGTDGQGNQLLREREEVAPHFTSYSVIQRTASRSGKS